MGVRGVPIVPARLGQLDLLVGVDQRLGGVARGAVEPGQRVVGERADAAVDVLDVAAQRIRERRRRPAVVAGVAVGVGQVDRVQHERRRVGGRAPLELTEALLEEGDGRAAAAALGVRLAERAVTRPFAGSGRPAVQHQEQSIAASLPAPDGDRADPSARAVVSSSRAASAAEGDEELLLGLVERSSPIWTSAPSTRWPASGVRRRPLGIEHPSSVDGLFRIVVMSWAQPHGAANEPSDGPRRASSTHLIPAGRRVRRSCWARLGQRQRILVRRREVGGGSAASGAASARPTARTAVPAVRPARAILWAGSPRWRRCRRRPPARPRPARLDAASTDRVAVTVALESARPARPAAPPRPHLRRAAPGGRPRRGSVHGRSRSDARRAGCGRQ